MPYVEFLGIEFDRRGDELTALLPFADKLIGNPMLPAIHGGVTAAFLETSAIIELGWSILWDQIESGQVDPEELTPGQGMNLEKALEQRFARGVEIDKKERRKAGKVLVKLLLDDYMHVRTAAIECLKKMYRNNGLLYQPDAPLSDRKNKQRDWKKHVDRK